MPLPCRWLLLSPSGAGQRPIAATLRPKKHRTAMPRPRSSPCCCASTPETRLGLAQIARDVREGGGQRGAHGGDAGDDHHGDQGGDQAIFDGGGAVFVAEEVLEDCMHW